MIRSVGFVSSVRFSRWVVEDTDNRVVVRLDVRVVRGVTSPA